MSKAYETTPYRFEGGSMRVEVAYTPGEARSGLFGGNSNWCGPVWMPVNFLLIGALRRFHRYFGPDFVVDCPSGSARMMTLDQVADELTRRLTRLFARGTDGRRASMTPCPRSAGAAVGDHLLFHEFFHGDTGRGLGASLQTGWTGLIANLLHASPPGCL